MTGGRPAPRTSRAHEVPEGTSTLPGRTNGVYGAPRPLRTRLLDADELAVRWRVPKAQVYRLARSGQIPTIKLGRYYRFRLDAIEAWEDEDRSNA